MVNKTSIYWSSVAFGGKIDMGSQLSVFLRANFSNPNRAYLLFVIVTSTEIVSQLMS